MNTLDFSPLYRSSIGFDRLAQLMDNAMRREGNQPSYPPYNIELLEEDHYRITMAIAGFDVADVDIELEKGTLTISGKKPEEATNNFLYHGIAGRNFERKFQLADHVKVTQAHLENGLLHIELVREIPEAMKPRKIQIESKQAKAPVQNTQGIAA